uniref:Methyltranfer_dom domain-containing protein n=1 Tax=Strongyloides stercoralis TaxID=6248 RepID=A0A0K0EQS4_STRER
MEKELVNKIYDILKDYGHYADQYMLDYYIDNQWHSIPNEWQNFFENKKDNIEAVALYLLDFTNKELDEEVPSTLLKLKNDIKHVFDTLCNNNSFYQAKKYDFSTVPKSLLTKIKQKKLHELEYLIPLIEHLYIASNCSFNRIVDCGAGIGHLSRLLAYFFKDYINVEVSTVEGNDKFVDQSIKLDQIFENKLKFIEQKSPNFKIQRVSKLVSDKSDLLNDDSSNHNKNLILGLHTCGDFASTLIKHFCLNTNAAALVNIGCCYHKINNGNDMKYRQIYDNSINSISENYNYPMSNEKNIFPNLSYAARELACHGLKQFKEKLNSKKGILSSFKINLYRAKLEHLIFSITSDKNYRHLGLRSVLYNENLSFEEYIEKALLSQKEIMDKINLFKNQNYELFRKMIDIDINDIWKIFTLYVIRLSIAPILEIVILLDRIIYLKEHGLNSYIIDLFDSSISPRCYAIVCLK